MLKQVVIRNKQPVYKGVLIYGTQLWKETRKTGSDLKWWTEFKTHCATNILLELSLACCQLGWRCCMWRCPYPSFAIVYIRSFLMPLIRWRSYLVFVNSICILSCVWFLDAVASLAPTPLSQSVSQSHFQHDGTRKDKPIVVMTEEQGCVW